MKKLLKRFRKLFDGYVIKRFQSIAPKWLIIDMYKKIARNELLIDIKKIRVKKGAVRYTLLICKDKNLKTKFNLGRI